MNKNTSRVGHVAIVGRPNVGKSSLMNCLIGDEITIVSKKKQTTRNRILGVLNYENNQIVFFDTPGIDFKKKYQINQRLNKIAFGELNNMDLVVWVLEANKFTNDDKRIGDFLPKNLPTLVVLNKLDLSKNSRDKELVFENVSNFYSENIKAILPISVKKKFQISNLTSEILKFLPIGDKIYEEDFRTDRSNSFRTSEIIRKTIMLFVGDELHYSISVIVDKINDVRKEKSSLEIFATIYVGKTSHRSMILGLNGLKIRKINKLSQFELSNFFKKNVSLNLWIKVKKNWINNSDSLPTMGVD